MPNVYKLFDNLDECIKPIDTDNKYIMWKTVVIQTCKTVHNNFCGRRTFNFSVEDEELPKNKILRATSLLSWISDSHLSEANK